MAETQASELAWSAADDDSDDGLAVLRPWRAVYRTALGVFAVCVAVAGAIVVGDRHWSAPHSVTLSAAWPGIPPVPVSELPTPQPPPASAAPIDRPKAYASSPAAEHLQPPARAVDVNADAVFLTGLQRTGSVITDVPAAIASGHSACTDLAHGFTPEQVAAAVMNHNRTLSAVNALGMVYSAVAAYCPEYAASR